MPLNKDILGQAIYDTRAIYSNKTITQLIATYGDLEAAKLHAAKAEAAIIISHFKDNIKITIPGLGLAAGATLVTGSSITGSIT